MTPAPRAPRLSLRGVSKHFGGVTALDGVDFDAWPGEVVALVGDNGAGKSTLTKIIAGTYRADAGDLTFDGVPVRLGTPEVASALGIATVYQDLALCDNLDVVENLFLGRERLRGGRLDDERMEQEAREVLTGLAVKLPSLRRPVALLSGGQRQSVAVARAVLWGSKLVLLDEPTAALGVEQTALVLALVGQLRARGLAVVLISHNLSDVFQVADRISVLHLGRSVATFTRAETTPEQVIAAITGGSALSAPVMA